MKNDHNSLYKSIYIFLFFCKGLKLLWCVRQLDGVKQDRLLYWPITSLDHSALCYFQGPHLALLLLGQGCSTGGLVWATGPSGALSMTASWLWLGLHWLQLTSRYLHISPHNTYNFQLDCVILFCLFTQVCLWLTAQLRVNMQCLLMNVKQLPESITALRGELLILQETFVMSGLPRHARGTSGGVTVSKLD